MQGMSVVHRSMSKECYRAGTKESERSWLPLCGASKRRGLYRLCVVCHSVPRRMYNCYPITPQSEVLETLALEKPWETTGMVVLQAESEVAAINMIYGGAGAGKRVLTSSSSPGVALMQEGIAYMAGSEIPGLIVNVQRGGPGYNPAVTERLFPSYAWWWQWRLLCYRAGTKLCSGDG